MHAQEINLRDGKTGKQDLPWTAPSRFDRNFWWNVAEGLFVAGGFSLFSLQVFLATWLTQLGAGPVWIGLLTTVWFVGFALPQPYSALRARPLPLLKPYIMKWILWQRAGVLGLAVGVWVVGKDHPHALIALTFGAVLVFTVTMGTANPVWLQFIGKLTPPDQRGRLHGIRALAGGGMGLVAASVGQALLVRYPFPTNYALLFGVAFLFLMASWLTYFGVKETLPSQRAAAAPAGSVWREAFKTLTRDGDFSRFLWVALVVHVAILMPANFFVTFGLQAGVITSDRIAVVAVVGGLAIMGWSPVFGWVGDRFGNHRLLVISSVCGLLSSGFGWFTPWGLPWLLAAVVWSGGAGVSVTIGVINLILEYAPPEEAAHYTSIASPMLAAAGALSPLAGGLIAERWGYGTMMACAWGLSVLAAGLVPWFLFQGRREWAPVRAMADTPPGPEGL